MKEFFYVGYLNEKKIDRINFIHLIIIDKHILGNTDWSLCGK